MKHPLCWLVVSLLTLSIVSPPAAAANPQVTVKVENATASEAVAALSRASGIALDLQLPDRAAAANDPQVAKVLETLDARASFAWSNMSFARALRQIATRFQLHVMPNDPGYMLMPNPWIGVDAPRVPQKPVGLAEVQGHRLYPLSLRIERQHELNFQAALPPGLRVPHNSRLQVQLWCELGEGDAATITGVENLTAKDDRGNILVGEVRSGRMGRGFRTQQAYPDQWSETVSLSGPHPHATRLEWLEGDLMTYSVNESSVLEIPLPITGQGPRGRLGAMTVQAIGLDVKAGQDEGQPASAQLNLNLAVPAELRAGMPLDQANITAVLVGASGKLYRVGGINGGGSGEGEMHQASFGVGLPEEPLVKIRLQAVERAAPRRLVTFRMKDIPLPREGIFAARKVAPPPVRPRRPAPQPVRPVTEKGGGILVSQVLIQGRPAGEGTVAVGVAARTRDGWSALRWTDVDLGKDGALRVEGLQPGTYRILRIYHPKEVPSLPGPGLWSGGELEIQVVEGKETSLPPLRWVTSPENHPTPKTTTPRPMLKRLPR
ncbi:MAG TPA: hypothetical protein VK689_21160 [Armatimonadota bacterium]|nr:hypothetical protein [Armatimonadota bacterium]